MPEIFIVIILFAETS